MEWLSLILPKDVDCRERLWRATQMYCPRGHALGSGTAPGGATFASMVDEWNEKSPESWTPMNTLQFVTSADLDACRASDWIVAVDGGFVPTRKGIEYLLRFHDKRRADHVSESEARIERFFERLRSMKGGKY